MGKGGMLRQVALISTHWLHHRLMGNAVKYQVKAASPTTQPNRCQPLSTTCVIGPVSKLRLLGDYAHTTRIAFIEFVHADGAMAALNCSGALLGSLPIRVSPSKTPVRSEAGGAQKGVGGGGRSGPNSGSLSGSGNMAAGGACSPVPGMGMGAGAGMAPSGVTAAVVPASAPTVPVVSEDAAGSSAVGLEAGAAAMPAAVLVPALPSPAADGAVGLGTGVPVATAAAADGVADAA